MLFEPDEKHSFMYNLLFSLINNLLYSSLLYRERLAAENQLQAALNELKTYNVRLKRINDDFGHEEGDFVISTCAEILRTTFRNIDIIGRIGGDEFVVLASHLDTSVVGRMHARLEANLESFNEKSGKPYPIEMSIGWIASSQTHPKSLDTLFREADTMMYQIKKNKRDSFQ